MTTATDFYSVQKSIQDNREFLLNFTQRLNAVSRSIVDLENHLKESGLCIQMHFIIDINGYLMEGGYIQYAETISWMKDEKGNFRLMRAGGRLFNEKLGPLQACSDDSITVTEGKPLIECKSEMRY